MSFHIYVYILQVVSKLYDSEEEQKNICCMLKHVIPVEKLQ